MGNEDFTQTSHGMQLDLIQSPLNVQILKPIPARCECLVTMIGQGRQAHPLAILEGRLDKVDCSRKALAVFQFIKRFAPLTPLVPLDDQQLSEQGVYVVFLQARHAVLDERPLSGFPGSFKSLADLFE